DVLLRRARPTGRRRPFLVLALSILRRAPRRALRGPRRGRRADRRVRPWGVEPHGARSPLALPGRRWVAPLGPGAVHRPPLRAAAHARRPASRRDRLAPKRAGALGEAGRAPARGR